MPELYSFVFLKEELDGVEWNKSNAIEFLTAQKIPFMQSIEDDRMICFITKMGEEDKEYTLAAIGQQVYIVVDKTEAEQEAKDEEKDEEKEVVDEESGLPVDEVKE